MRLSLPYVYSTVIGYGRLGVYLAEGLDDLGVDIFDHDQKLNVPVNDARPRRPLGRCANVMWVALPMHATGWWEGQSPNLFTMWEATKLPPKFTETIGNFDRVFVPSDENVELFSRHHDNVFKAPLGVDPSWAYRERKPPSPTFRFLTVGSGARKNVETVARAFRTVFAHPDQFDPRPELIIKSMTGVGNLYGFDGVTQISGRIDDEDELALYESAHCFVSGSRGEGFGFMPLQAMAQGMPTIVPNAHGHREYAHLASHPISTHRQKALYTFLGEAGDWWDPDFEELCEAMWDVYTNYDTHAREAALTAPGLLDAYSWSRTATCVMEGFGEALEAPDVTSDTWVGMEQKRYPVKVIVRNEAELPNGLHIWEPEQLYWETADVKRLLFEAGILHPDVLQGDDLGLSEAELARIPNMQARNNFCPTCHQQLNTRPSLADAYEKGEIPA